MADGEAAPPVKRPRGRPRKIAAAPSPVVQEEALQPRPIDSVVIEPIPLSPEKLASLPFKWGADRDQHGNLIRTEAPMVATPVVPEEDPDWRERVAAKQREQAELDAKTWERAQASLARHQQQLDRSRLSLHDQLLARPLAPIPEKCPACRNAIPPQDRLARKCNRCLTKFA